MTAPHRARAPLSRQVSRDLRTLALDVDRYVQAVGRRLGVPATDVHAVGVLHAQPSPPSATELGAALGLTPSATTSLVDRLERADHAHRVPTPADSRRTLVVLTDAAREHSRTHFEAMNDAVDGALAAATPEDAAAFARVLADVVARAGAATREAGEVSGAGSPRRPS